MQKLRVFAKSKFEFQAGSQAVTAGAEALLQQFQGDGAGAVADADKGNTALREGIDGDGGALFVRCHKVGAAHSPGIGFRPRLDISLS